VKRPPNRKNVLAAMVLLLAASAFFGATQAGVVSGPSSRSHSATQFFAGS
jgi:hypothetical protein